MKHLALHAAAGVFALGGAVGWAQAAAAPATHLFGKLEKAKIVEGTPIVVPARLDAGVDQSTLYATSIKYFSGEGGMWVSFTTDSGEAIPAKVVTISKPVLKDLHIKERTGGVTHRPVVKLNLCVGGTAFETEVSVVIRTAFVPPLVLSQADVGKLGPVDNQKQFLAGNPDCAPPAPMRAAPADAAASAQ
jgi:hypothetical protein